jgi:hypothetical protein
MIRKKKVEHVQQCGAQVIDKWQVLILNFFVNIDTFCGPGKKIYSASYKRNQ